MWVKDFRVIITLLLARQGSRPQEERIARNGIEIVILRTPGKSGEDRGIVDD
jgi:hypothetical protein